MEYCYLETPIGSIMLAGENGVLSQVVLPLENSPRAPAADWRHDPAALQDASTQLGEYFAGTRQKFDLPLRPGGTEFQLQVLQELQRIPYGQTVSYADIACRIGRPKAMRAVGAANGRNPIPIVIPCHRVIGKNGDLTGFGGGIEAKEALLLLEAENSALLQG